LVTWAKKAPSYDVAIGNPQVACAQSFTPWQQATIKIMLTISLTIACSRYISNGVILNAHPVRGESHSQHNTTEEVATTSPRFYIEPRQSHVPCVKAELGKASTSWSQHHFVDVSLTYVMVLLFTHILFMVNHTINATPPERLQQ